MQLKFLKLKHKHGRNFGLKHNEAKKKSCQTHFFFATFDVHDNYFVICVEEKNPINKFL